jgi:hypothetical protein
VSIQRIGQRSYPLDIPSSNIPFRSFIMAKPLDSFSAEQNVNVLIPLSSVAAAVQSLQAVDGAGRTIKETQSAAGGTISKAVAQCIRQYGPFHVENDFPASGDICKNLCIPATIEKFDSMLEMMTRTNPDNGKHFTWIECFARLADSAIRNDDKAQGITSNKTAAYNAVKTARGRMVKAFKAAQEAAAAEAAAVQQAAEQKAAQEAAAVQQAAAEAAAVQQAAEEAAAAAEAAAVQQAARDAEVAEVQQLRAQVAALTAEVSSLKDALQAAVQQGSRKGSKAAAQAATV